MAFNPFTSFRRHQKVWMATVLLLCMVTFVLCTGVGGDLSDRLLRWFAPRHGNALAELGGRNIYQEDLQRLKDQRKMAEKFVRTSMEMVISRITDHLSQDEPAAGKGGKVQRENYRNRLGAVERELKARLALPRYFEGDLKIESLLDFMLWRKQADRLEINLTAEGVRDMFYREIFAVVPTGSGGREQLYALTDESRVMYDMRPQFPGITGANIAQALMDEYRVRIAKLATYQAQARRFRDTQRVGNDRNLLMEVQLLKPRYPEEFRAPLSPAQLWDIYKQKRTPYDVSLVPIRVASFQDKIKDPGTDKLKAYFESHKGQPYDPASPKPGFEVPQMVKVSWIMADPASPAYEKPAQIMSIVDTMPPLPIIGPFEPLANAVRMGASNLALDASLERNYEIGRRAALDPRFTVNVRDLLDAEPAAKYLIAPLTEPAGPALLSYLAKPTATGVASALAAAAADPLTALAPYRVDAAAGVQGEVDKLVADESKPRVQLAASLISLGASSPFAAPALWLSADRAPRFLPLSAVRKEFQEKYEAQLSRTWTAANMAIVKEKLDPLSDQTAIRRRVGELIGKYGLKHGATEKFYNKFDIGAAPELAPLRESFEKDRESINLQMGTSGKPDMLKENDFYKLFFESSESGSGRYVIRPWPPILDIKENPARGLVAAKVSMFEQSGKPILFWKTDESHARAPEKLDEALARVLASWKTEKAREELAMPKAKEIALVLLNKSGGDYAPAIRAEAKKLDTAPIDIRGLAVLYPDRIGEQGFGQGRGYREFPLPKELSSDKDDAKLYPRDDMVKQLLAITNLQKPIQSDFKALDDLNKELFDITKKLPEQERAGKFVQVLTNKPHTMFWVAAVVGRPGPDMGDFAKAYKDFPLDTFVAIAQEEAGKQYLDDLLLQLRREMGASVKADETARKNFDSGD